MASASPVIYLDIGSIHNEILRRHPEIKQSSGFLNRYTTDKAWATISDTTECAEGREIEVYRDDEEENYYGFTIKIVRWRTKASHAIGQKDGEP